jgi:uncharacterized membrane protein
MVIAVVGDTAYNILLLLHILTAMAAFAPAFAHPFLSEQSKAMDSANQGKLLGFITANGRRIYAPALIITGLLGFGVAGLSDKVYSMSQGWLVAAFIVWIAMNGVLHALILPNERKWADGDNSAEQKVRMGGMVITLLLLVMLYLMTFKPGV